MAASGAAGILAVSLIVMEVVVIIRKTLQKKLQSAADSNGKVANWPRLKAMLPMDAFSGA
jgi:hypothetical protein